MTIAIDLRPLLGGTVSGVTTYIRNLIPLLLTLGKRHTFVLFANARPTLAQAVFRSFSAANAIPVATHIPNKLLNISLAIFRWPKLDRLIQKTCGRKIDLFFAPDPRPVALSRGVALVSTFHDLSFVHFPRNFTLRSRLFHRLSRPRLLTEESNRIIAVSQCTKEDVYKTYGAPQEKISVIYEGVNRNLACPSKTEALVSVRKKYHLPERFFLSLSTLEPRKNLLTVLKAFQRFCEQTGSDHALVIAGRTQPRIFRKLSLPEQPSVMFPGFIAEEDKGALLALATALVSMSYLEGFGLPLVEAMRCGTLVIAARAGAIPEIVGDAAILVDPFDIEEIARAFAKVLHEEVQVELSGKGRARVQQFSWEEAAKQTLQLFENLA